MGLEEVLDIVMKLWPLLALQFVLMFWALFDVLYRRKTRSLSMLVWILIIVLINFFGPIAYFLFGRAEQ